MKQAERPGGSIEAVRSLTMGMTKSKFNLPPCVGDIAGQARILSLRLKRDDSRHRVTETRWWMACQLPTGYESEQTPENSEERAWRATVRG